MDINKIIYEFLDFKTISIIKSVKYTPDVNLILLLVDNKQFVLDETDYFDDIHEGNGIKESFNLRVVKWVYPKKYDKTKYDDTALRIGNMIYGLAIVE